MYQVERDRGSYIFEYWKILRQVHFRRTVMHYISYGNGNFLLWTAFTNIHFKLFFTYSTYTDRFAVFLCVQYQLILYSQL